jgi:glycine/D-amino acid oxidase-like deaminating enzyme
MVTALTPTDLREVDVTVIGGGLVGTALAYGLAARGRKVVIVDEGDVAHRASRGNFGLVWVQGKGAGMPTYARWTLESARLYRGFVQTLQEETGISCGLRQAGGVSLLLDDQQVEKERLLIEQLRHEAGNAGYDCTILDREAIQTLLPGIGEAVVAGAFCPHDGDVDPLLVLRALHAACRRLGVRYEPNCHVDKIQRRDGSWLVNFGSRAISAGKLVLAAGLGTASLAAPLNLVVPLRPNRGQLMVTARMPPQIPLPTDIVRQAQNGTVLIGATHENVGLDETTDARQLRHMSVAAIRAFPALQAAEVVRAWGALRIMTPDTYPIYEQPEGCPGLFLVCVHSGVTLAAVHARRLAEWIDIGNLPKEMNCFTRARFDV